MGVQPSGAERWAFEEGKEAFRANKDREDNPYPKPFPYHEFWDKGWKEQYDASLDR